ncbi:MAG: aminotransferase class III-fold pyridoxal phosphate-dependent enzyme, partial [Syntrophobacteraceae bacterium]|nr:aminotransferase class III-fold pyridoxal phosphate-dependent enzyme [Syntrophobacteraceae bacterium]
SCPFKMTYPGCGLYCLDFVRKIIENNTAGSLAAIIVETMQGTAGNIIPPPEFLPGLLQIARENDALLIADEMITGFGRTGRMFGSNHTTLRPDIMTIGKGMGSGFPVSGLISTDEITASKPFSKPSSSSSSYGGNPLASTAAHATITTILEESLVDNSRKVGEYLLDGLRKLQEKYEFIGDVRGIGLLLGVELVKDRRTKEPLDKAVTRQMFLETVKRGMVCMNYKPNFRINPPLILSREEADEGLGIIDEVFRHVADHIPYK